MKSSSYTFSIDKPCSESWDHMTASEKGKFCLSCQHEVIDFSSLRDDEIIRIIEKASGSICGRFENKQLSRPMLHSTNLKRPYAIRAIVAGIVLLTIVSPVLTEAHPLNAQVESAAYAKESVSSKTLIPSDSTYLYKGRVLNINNRSGVSGVNVFLSDSSQMVTTDSAGYFKLPIPASVARTAFTIKFVDDSFMYEPNNVLVEGIRTDYNQSYKVYLLPYKMHVMGKVQMVPSKPEKHRKNK